MKEGTPKTNTKTITHNFGTELDYILQAILKILRSLFVQRVFFNIYLSREFFKKIYIFVQRVGVQIIITITKDMDHARK
jgi:hypothetical protein